MAESDHVVVGDIVDIQGGGSGLVMFVGQVHGKEGIFAGVELSESWAAKGLHDGVADGKRYFRTKRPVAGVFLPLSKVSKRGLTRIGAPYGSDGYTTGFIAQIWHGSLSIGTIAEFKGVA
jgi:hypothetical protein